MEVKCPKCNSSNVEVEDGVAYPTNPVQYKYECKDCHNIFYDHVFKPRIFKPKNSYEGVCVGDPAYSGLFGGQQGWICPKCGNVMSPSQSYCIFCYKSTTTVVGVNTSTDQIFPIIDDVVYRKSATKKK